MPDPSPLLLQHDGMVNVVVYIALGFCFGAFIGWAITSVREMM
jgi:hypothetical protein